MSGSSFFETCGEVVALHSEVDWVAKLLLDGTDGVASMAPKVPTVTITVEASPDPFPTISLNQLTRNAWSGGADLVVADLCGTGFDLHVALAAERPNFTVRWRPSSTRTAARLMLPDRFQLLAREALMHYPVLWLASVHGRAPLHAVACTVGRGAALLAGPGGVGKSTLLRQELSAGGTATSDNLCVGDGRTVWGLLEPMRVDGTGGPRTTHGRVEVRMPGRVTHLVPDLIVIVKRGHESRPELLHADPKAAVRSLVTGTYAAGELSRFWAYAATLAAGSGIGPAHPHLSDVARAFAERLRCYELRLARRPGIGLSEVFEAAEAIA